MNHRIIIKLTRSERSFVVSLVCASAQKIFRKSGLEYNPPSKFYLNMRFVNMSKIRPMMSVFFIAIFLFAPQTLFAAFNVTLAPAIIDGEAKAREVLRYKLTIKNDSNATVTLYPWARDVNEQGEDSKSQDLDPSESLLSWLEFSRSEMVVPAGASVDLSLLVQVSMHARPGIYHAVLRVSDGPNRVQAEANPDKTASMMLNIRVLDDAHERLQLGVFMTEKNLFMGDQATFDYRLDNTGNRGVTPIGKIRIFDRRGQEVDVVNVNGTQDKIEPEKNHQLASVWQSGGHFGKYKAMLDISYGKSGTIQDTVYFWVLPWQKVLSSFLAIAIMCVVVALLIHSYTASGGKKLALVREHFSTTSEDDEDYDMNHEGEGNSESFYARVRNKLKRTTAVDPYLDNKEQYVDALKELPAPPRVRTRYSIADSPKATESLRLAPRVKKNHIDPAHIVRLKR